MSLFVSCGPFLSITPVIYWPTLSEGLCVLVCFLWPFSVSYACNLLADFVRGVVCPCLFLVVDFCQLHL